MLTIVSYTETLLPQSSLELTQSGSSLSSELTNQSPPESTTTSNVTASTPHMDRQTSQNLTSPYQSAVVFSEQFVDGR